MIAAAFDSTARFVWSRNRKVLMGCAAVYLALFLAYQLFTPDQMHAYVPQTMAILRLAPFFLPVIMLITTVNIATLQLGGREGSFPRIFYTLPIKTHEMVLPFVVYGLGLTALLWGAGAFITDWRVLTFGETLAYWVPCMSTSLIVWFQALAWTPFRRGWMRAWLLNALLVAHAVIVVLLVGRTLTQTQVVTASLLQIPLAFLVAFRGVKRDRSGVSQTTPVGQESAPDPNGARLAKAAKNRALHAFPDGFRAQLWFESHIHRWNGIALYALPVLCLGLVILAELAGTPKKSPQTFSTLVHVTLSLFIWITVAIGLVAGFLFASFRAASGWQRKEAYAMPPFFAALPMSTADFVWAKLITMSTRVLWLAGLALLVCGWLAWRAGILDPNNGAILALREQHGDFTATAMLATPVLAFLMFLLSAAASMLCLCLAGRSRNWMNWVNLTRYTLAGVGAALVAIYWGRHHAPPPGLEEVVRVLAAMKIATLVVLVLHVARTGMMSWSRLATLLGVALTTFGALMTATLLFLPEGLISLLTLIALLVLLSPVLATIAAPLALQLNRTR